MTLFSGTRVGLGQDLISTADWCAGGHGMERDAKNQRVARGGVRATWIKSRQLNPDLTGRHSPPNPGARVAAWLGGGAIPASARGGSRDGLISTADWCVLGQC